MARTKKLTTTTTQRPSTPAPAPTLSARRKGARPRRPVYVQPPAIVPKSTADAMAEVVAILLGKD